MFFVGYGTLASKIFIAISAGFGDCSYSDEASFEAGPKRVSWDEDRLSGNINITNLIYFYWINSLGMTLWTNLEPCERSKRDVYRVLPKRVTVSPRKLSVE